MSKRYVLRQNVSSHVTLAEAMLHRITHPFARAPKEEFWALKDVSFDLQRGSVLGVIGRNGAGKSTLLKILSRITAPSEGEADLFGRVGALLEVGTGFHPELTGRENIYLNGSILGMRRKEIERRLDDIVEFAGVDRFLDTPVKRYSSGMYVRLAFAVAAHLETEILLVDEVLAVGDASFQERCLAKMQGVARSGRSVLFVSHQLSAVTMLCDSAIILSDGHLAFEGNAAQAVETYLSKPAVDPQGAGKARRAGGSGELMITAIAPTVSTVSSGERIVIDVEVEPKKPTGGTFYLACIVKDPQGYTVTQCDSRLVGQTFRADQPLATTFTLDGLWLRPGPHTFDFFVCEAGIIDGLEDACTIEVSPVLPFPSSATGDATKTGVVFASFSFGSEPVPLRTNIGP